MSQSVLHTRHLRNLSTSPIGLGCMGLSEFYGPTDDSASIRLIHEAIDYGVLHFDTADIYGYGHNEVLLGRALKDQRNRNITIATKCGIIRRADDPTARGVNNTPQYIKECCDASLKRLGVDAIDLYYMHRIADGVPIEDTMSVLKELLDGGKIRHVGLSEVDAETIVRANAVFPLTAIQVEYSLWSRGIEGNNVLKTCKQLGIGIVAYSPLGRGFLTGAIKKTSELAQDDFRRILPRFSNENIQSNLTLVTLIEKMAEKKGCTPAQLALAWVLAQSDSIIPIPGTKKIERLKENMDALRVPLDSSELAQLNQISNDHAPKGERYTQAAMKAYNLSA